MLWMVMIGCRGGTGTRQFLEHRGIQAREAQAAHLFRGVEAAEAQFASLGDHVQREVRLLVPLGGEGGHGARSEIARTLLEGQLVFVEFKIHACLLFVVLARQCGMARRLPLWRLA
jgi:hypothetical protein